MKLLYVIPYQIIDRILKEGLPIIMCKTDMVKLDSLAYRRCIFIDKE